MADGVTKLETLRADAAKPPETEPKPAPPIAGPDAVKQPLKAEPETGAKKYRVSLKDNPPLELHADDRLDAINKYKRWAGINSTIHEFSVDAL